MAEIRLVVVDGKHKKTSVKETRRLRDVNIKAELTTVWAELM
jgi:hypothetical protein